MEYNGTLSELDLSHNEITHLPADMFESSRRIRVIDASNNFLKEIHASVFKNLNSLEILNLSNNKIISIESIILPSLRILDLSNNSITDLDFGFDKAYPQLTDLNLSHNNLNDSINGTLTLIKKLQHLDISYNNFNLLDNENFNHLSHLITLNLSHNEIKSLEIQTFPDSLLELRVGFNFLTEIPKNLLKIQILSIEYNQIGNTQDITDELEGLRFLNISGNKLENLSNFKLSNLKTLDLSYNNFLNIPQTLSKENYPVLETLIFNGNPMKKIEFPSSLNIKSLIMRNNSEIEQIDKNSFEKLNRLGVDDCLNLTLTDNRRLHVIDEEALKGLHLCYVSYYIGEIIILLFILQGVIQG